MSQSNAEIDDAVAEQLACMSDQFIREMRLGTCASVGEFAARHPHLADRIAANFPALLALEQLRVEQTRAMTAPARAEPPPRLGDFRLDREIGRGGMGVVYEAQQVSLQRQVAVKLLPQTGASPREIERFQQESRIAACLHHSNIVPIYASGTEDGWHFFAMQLIDGFGLDKVLHEPERLGPTINASDQGFARWVASVGMQVAECLDYAHQLGIIHQDVKPANLLLDRSGRVWLSDFGLASLLPQAGACRGGTSRYRAPERARGLCDERSDLFSLGATLHDLLVSRLFGSGFAANHAQCAFENQLSMRPSRSGGRPPGDLVAILRKATQQQPEQRYSSTAALAADLHRFLEGRVVSVRPVGWLGQLRRWAQRNRALAASLALLAAFVAASGALFVYTDVQTTRLNRRLLGLNQQLAARNERLTSAFFAVDALLRCSLPETSGGTPDARTNGRSARAPKHAGGEFTASQVNFPLSRLLPGYAALEHELGGDPEVWRKAYRSPRRVGEAMFAFGRLEEAEAAFGYALELVRLAEKLPDPPAGLMRFREARIMNDLAEIRQERGEFGRGRQFCKEALQHLVECPEDLENGLWAHEQARALFGVHFAGEHELEGIRLTRATWGCPLHAEEGNSLHARNGAADKLAEIIGLCRATLQKRDSFHAAVLLGNCLIKHARLAAGDTAERSLGFDVGLNYVESIAEKSENEPRFQHFLARALSADDLFPRDGENADYARQNLRRALDIAAPLAEKYPTRPGYTATLADIHHKLARLAWRTGETAAAAEHLSIAIAKQSELISRFPQNARYRAWYAVYLKSHACCLKAGGTAQRSADCQRAASREVERMAATDADIDSEFAEAIRRFVAE